MDPDVELENLKMELLEVREENRKLDVKLALTKNMAKSMKEKRNRGVDSGATVCFVRQREGPRPLARG